MFGGFLVSISVAKLTSPEYWTTAYQSLTFRDLTQGLIKPIFFAIVISLVGCHFGLKTVGGTEGVGRSTTQAVVVASVLIIVLDAVITRFLIGIHFA
jgi:phospholipid/cholesterol/gamma-HCH transport system permease protein